MLDIQIIFHFLLLYGTRQTSFYLNHTHDYFSRMHWLQHNFFNYSIQSCLFWSFLRSKQKKSADECYESCNERQYLKTQSMFWPLWHMHFAYKIPLSSILKSFLCTVKAKNYMRVKYIYWIWWVISFLLWRKSRGKREKRWNCKRATGDQVLRYSFRPLDSWNVGSGKALRDNQAWAAKF